MGGGYSTLYTPDLIFAAIQRKILLCLCRVSMSISVGRAKKVM